MTIDKMVYALAEMWTEDFGPLHTQKLAEEIQHAIEDYIASLEVVEDE